MDPVLRPPSARTAALPTALPARQGPDALAARGTLRRQIVRLERRLGAVAVELGSAGRWLPLPGIEAAPGHRRRPLSQPRLLSLGELEVVRDGLVARISEAEGQLACSAVAEAHARRRLESMLASPREHRFEIVRRSDLGQPGCGAYQVRPRLGLLGILFDWWCVKLSSGCP